MRLMMTHPAPARGSDGDGRLHVCSSTIATIVCFVLRYKSGASTTGPLTVDTFSHAFGRAGRAGGASFPIACHSYVLLQCPVPARHAMYTY